MTLEEFWNQPLNLKWTPVVIEGKKIKDKYLIDQLFSRLDELTCPYGCNNGRNGIRSAIASEIDIPTGISGGYAKQISKAINGEKSDDLFYIASDINFANIDRWTDWWGYNKFSGDGSIFCTRVNSGKSFFNVKTGSIKPTLSYIGKYPDMKEVQKEVKWFTKEFPSVNIYVTIYKDESSPIGTLHLFNENIELVETKNYNIKKLDAYSKSRLSKVLKKTHNNISIFFHKNVLRLFDKDGYVYWHNYSLLNEDYSNDKILSSDEIFKKIHYWYDITLEEKGSFQNFKLNN